MTRKKTFASAILVQADAFERSIRHEMERARHDAALLLANELRGSVPLSKIAVAMTAVFKRSYTATGVSRDICNARLRNNKRVSSFTPKS